MAEVCRRLKIVQLRAKISRDGSGDSGLWLPGDNGTVVQCIYSQRFFLYIDRPQRKDYRTHRSLFKAHEHIPYNCMDLLG